MQYNVTSDSPVSEIAQPPVPQFYSDKKNNGFKFPWPVLLGVLVALGIGTAVWFVVIKNHDAPLLNPLGGSNAGKPQGVVKDVMNPLTGVMYTAEEAAPWANIRPLGVMVNNHLDARPQSGLIYADTIYEVVAEGGITRYLAFFLSNTPEKIGPVRSTREYYLVLVKEIGDAMLMHIGYSPQALIDIDTWPVRSLFRGGATFWRDNPRNVAIEHTAYVNGKDLRKLGDELGWDGKKEIKPWSYKDTQDTYSQEQPATDITIDFWYKGDYTGIFKYDAANNNYLRFTGYDPADQPVPLTDQETKQQLAVKNVIVQFAVEEAIAGDEKNRLDYQLVGSGEALIFVDGKVVKATWSKADRDSRTMFYDKNGREIQFNRGTTWISIVPTRNIDQVVYK